MSANWPQVLREHLAALAEPRTEIIPRAEASGRILMETIRADRDYPGADLGMMDGYAVAERQDDPYRVQGENLPGRGAGAALGPGEARRIFTGAPVPPGTRQVIPQEMTTREGDRLAVTAWPPTHFIRPRGQEGRTGDIVLEKGQRLGAAERSILAHVGAVQVRVAARPRIGHLVTGDEIVPADDPVGPDSIRDSNSDLVAALLADNGWAVAEHRRLPDRRDEIFESVRAMTANCDWLLISGGASVGDHDHARAALEAAGFSFTAHRLNLRPGAPVGLARRDDRWAAALPGNPLSHLVVLRLLILPLLAAGEGAPDAFPQLARARLESPLPATVPQRDTFWPAAVTLREGIFHARPSRFLSSGDLLGIARINGMISLPAGAPVPPPGEEISFLPLSLRFP